MNSVLLDAGEPEPPLPPNRELRHRTPSQEVRRAFLDAATALLEEEGLSALTIRAVATRAGAAPQSLYNRFGDKQGLLTAIAEEHFSDLARAMGEITEPDPRERLRLAGTIVHDLLTAHPRSYDLMWAVPPGPATRDAFAHLVRMVEYGQAAGAFIPGQAASLASAIWASINGAITVEVRQARAQTGSGEGVSVIDFQLVLDIILCGVCTG
ncbi:TetR/AcrR family transcriptional regulator [Actinomyces timonensis]|uniref:TetR/AcrR family transcriptional regulator n=1 Tax=Actinomyces timonensis TaxID=1288391 RepID=A0AAU8N1I0_9ACTO